MKTKIIALKQFRQNITKLWKEAQQENIRYIVMFHSRPILEVLPCRDTNLSFDAPVVKRSGTKIGSPAAHSPVEFYSPPTTANPAPDSTPQALDSAPQKDEPQTPIFA